MSRPLRCLPALVAALVLASPASAFRRDDLGPRRAAAKRVRVVVADRADRKSKPHPALRVNGFEIDSAAVDEALANGPKSWSRLRELHAEDKLLEKDQTRDEFIVLRELAIPAIVRHLFRDQDEANHARAQEAYEKAKAGESWEKLVSLYSTEPGVGPKGDLGVVAYDNLVSPFNRVMFDAPLGEVQPPVQTMFGWHVGKVVEVIPPREIPRADGSVVTRPETRHVEQILIIWDVGDYGDGRSSDLRVELMDITEHVSVEVLDPQYCDELPHWCARKPIVPEDAGRP